jgi:ribosomal protein L37AE/L43A
MFSDYRSRECCPRDFAGLNDIRTGVIYFRQKDTAMPQIVDPSSCEHSRRQLIAQDEEAEYWECLDCGELFEPGEISRPQTTSTTQTASSTQTKPSAQDKIDESLSDA